MASTAQSGTEPPSGYAGAGTTDQPYDQGNAPEQASAPGQEPPSGIQGKGTVDQPYDQGNQPEQPTNTATSESTTTPSSSEPLTSAATTTQSSGTPEVAPTTSTNPPTERGRDDTAQKTTSTGATRSHFGASSGGSKGLSYEERDVSPGEMKDGSHAVTSGVKGEGYQPGKMNRFKDKFGIGRH